MKYAVLIIVTILTVELARRSQIMSVAKNISKVAQKAAMTIRSSRISDHWKQKAINAYALAMFNDSLKLLGWLVVVFAPLMLVSIIDAVADTQYTQQFASISGVIACTAIATVYFIFRKRVE